MARGNVRVSITGDADGLGRATRDAERHLNRLDKGVAKTGSRLGSAVKWGAASVGIAGVGAAAAAATRTFVDFDKSMRNVNSIAQLNEKRFDQLSKRVLALAGPTAQAPKTLADGLYDLVSSGFDANESMRILEKSAIAATAGLTSTEVSTKAVAAVLNAYHLPAKKAGLVSDQLFQTVNRGVLSFEQLSSSIGDVLPFAASLGVGLDQVGASIATMTKAGISPEETMTRIKNVMVAMLKPGEDLKSAFDELGVSSGEALIKQKGFQGALEAIIGTTDGSKRAVAALFPNIRALGGALALTGKNAKGAEGDLKGMANTSGATAKAFEEQSKSVSVQWERTKARIQAAAATAGEWIVKAIIATDNWGKATKKWLINAWANVKRAFGDAMAAILHGFAALFDVMGKVPGKVGQPFRNAAKDINATADRVDMLGEKLKLLPRTVPVDIQVAVAMQDLASGKFKPLVARPGKNGDGWGIESKLRSGAVKFVQRGLDNGSIDPFGGVGPLQIFGGSGGLMGASPILAPFAALGSRFGLSVTSGLRPGAITSSGNPSYHATGHAIDVNRGTASGMLAYAQMMARMFGSRLKELIHTPLGFSIKNGQRVAPYATADHYDHVHVAMAQGGQTRSAVRALVGERGPEVVDLPAGAIVHPASISRRMRGTGDGWGRATTAARAAGFRGRALQMALAVAAAESGNFTAFVGDGGQSFSPWQIYHPAHPQYSTSRLLSDWTYAAKAAYQISSGGSNWSPWTMYNNGGYRQYLDEAAAAIAGRRGGSSGGKGGRKRARIRRGDRHGVVTGADPETVKPGRRADAGGFFGETVDFGSNKFGAGAALAALTEGTGDDLANAQAALKFFEAYLPAAIASGDPGSIQAVAGAVKQWRDEIKSLTEATNDLAEQQKESRDAHTAALEEHNKILRENQALAKAQGPALMSAFLQFINGGIGGNTGLGRQLPSSVGLGGLARA